MDVLDDILATLDLQGILYFRTDLSGSWGVTVPDIDYAARFHLVLQGTCHVQVKDGDNHALEAGDIILIPRGRSHVVSDSPVASAPPLETVLCNANYDGRGVLAVGDADDAAATQLLCGHFSFRPGADHPLLRALPSSFVISRDDRSEFRWLDELLTLVARNVFSGQVGSQSTVKRLSEIVFLEMLRAGSERQEKLQVIFDAFADKSIGQSLELMHQIPNKQWTIATLATAVGMSRSRFAERFKYLVGMGPMAYLTEWRLQKSLAMLDDGRTNVGRVATNTGYQSAAAFTRAFSSRFGVTPSIYRKDSTAIQH